MAGGLGLLALNEFHHMSFFSAHRASLAYLFVFCMCVSDAPAISLCHIWEVYVLPTHMPSPTHAHTHSLVNSPINTLGRHTRHHMGATTSVVVAIVPEPLDLDCSTLPPRGAHTYGSNKRGV